MIIITLLEPNRINVTNTVINGIKRLLCKHVYIPTSRARILGPYKYIEATCINCGQETLINICDSKRMSKVLGGDSNDIL